jgi:aryl-alcohol dehydrogenase-like predicted oxidoreductase
MRYKLLGHSGLKVSELCLGTMTFGTEFGWGSTKEESRKVFNLFVQKGGNFFDTANYYTRGTSESYLGEFMGKQREEFVLGTKYSLCTRTTDPNAGGNHRKNMIQSLDKSLQRLKMEYLDLYWVHAWDGFTPIEEVMRALDDMIRMGKILYIGISDMPAWLIAKANTLAGFRSLTPFIAMQLNYNLLERSIEREYLPMAKELDLAVTAWSPLAGGVLSGKYSKKIDDSSSEARYQINKMWGDRLMTPRNFDIVETVIQIAQELGRSPTQVALNWIRQKDNTIIPIVGAKTEIQLKDNLGCLDFNLNDDQINKLNEISKIDVGFPYDFLNQENVRKLIHGEVFQSIEDYKLHRTYI